MRKRFITWTLIALGCFITMLWWCGRETADGRRLTQIGADAGMAREIRESDAKKETFCASESSVVKKSSTPTKPSSFSLDPSAFVLPVGVRLDRDMDFGTPQFVGDWNWLLSGPAPGAKVEEILRAFVEANAKAFTLIPSDVLEHGRVWRDYESGGIRHVTWQQRHEGLDVFGARFAMHLTEKNELINVSSRALHFPSLLFHDEVKTTKADVEERFDVVESVEPIWYPLDMISCVKSWQVVAGKGMDYKLSVVRADTGEVAYEKPLAWAASEVVLNVFTDDSPLPMTPGPNAPTNYVPSAAARQMVNGEWSFNGNELQGNNATVYADRDDDDAPDGPVLTSASGVFDFAVDLTQGPETYVDFSQVQAFYWANFFHDRTYALGFDEASGNFQADNFGKGGVGGDALTVEVQNGGDLGFSYVNQGWYSGFGDGNGGKVVVSIFARSQPHRCGALDAQILLHEMTHGLSARLVGNGFGLSKTQSRGMAEGWSDFFALALLSNDTDDLAGCYPIMTYAGTSESFPTDKYYGIRRFPYSTDLAKAPQTLADGDPNQIEFPADVPKNPRWGSQYADQIHNLGEIWCLALWECRANLIEQHGFAGNELMMQLVVEGLKLTPEEPTFTQARDAILQADLVIHGGANQVDLWSGFAKRGLGFEASVPEVWTTVGIVESFELPFGLDQNVSETSGDGDGYVEPGESAALTLTLSSPELNLSNVTGQLIAVSSNINVTVSDAAPGSILQGGSAGMAFAFSVDHAFPGFTDAHFSLNVTTDKGSFELPVVVRIGNPNDYPPEILNVLTSDITENEATISWTTGLPSNGTLRYGLSTNYSENITFDAVLKTNHSVRLTGLQKGTDYHLQIVAHGDNGFFRASDDQQFTTRARIYVYADSDAVDELGTIEAPFKTLQAAAEASGTSGNEVLVAAGTYTGDHKEGVLHLDGTGYDVTISGGWSPDFSKQDHELYVCIIDGEQKRRGISLDNGAVLSVSRLFIIDGIGFWGGGILIRKSVLHANELKIEYCSSNVGNQIGGGLYGTLGAEISLVNTEIEKCEAGTGGGIAMVSSTTELIADKCLLKENRSVLGGGGGLDCMLGAKSFIKDSVFIGNSANYGGGGIIVRPYSEAAVENSTVALNFLVAESIEDPDSYGGGGISVSGSRSTGICFMKNTIVSHNRALQGEDLRCGEKSDCQAMFCVIGDVLGTLTLASNVLNEDPIFSRPEVGDLHIMNNSCCIDSGSYEYSNAGTDMDHEPRVFNNRIDIGADEFTDIDGDKIPDYWEKTYFSSIEDRTGAEDDDLDSLNTFGEYVAQSNPFEQDTDKDLLGDGAEVVAGMLPNNPDQDKDFMLDGWEVMNSLSPFTNEAALNLDGDCMTNLEEFRADTRANDASSWLGLTAVSRESGGTRLDWQGGKSSIQWLESSTNLMSWKTIIVFPAPTPEKNAIIVFDEGSYYRIRAHRDSQAD